MTIKQMKELLAAEKDESREIVIYVDADEVNATGPNKISSISTNTFCSCEFGGDEQDAPHENNMYLTINL